MRGALYFAKGCVKSSWTFEQWNDPKTRAAESFGEDINKCVYIYVYIYIYIYIYRMAGSPNM